MYECIWIKCFLLFWVLPLNKMKVVRKNVISFVMLHLTTIVLMSLCCQWLIEESGTHEIPSRWCRWKMVNTGMHWQSLCWLSLPCRSHITHGWVTHSFVFHIDWKRKRGREEEEKGDAGDWGGRVIKLNGCCGRMSRNKVGKWRRCVWFNHLFSTDRIHKSVPGLDGQVEGRYYISITHMAP